MLNFWATWCPPCRAEVPELIKIHGEAISGEHVIFGVDLAPTEKSPRALEEFLAEYAITYPILLDDGGVASRYGVRSIPTTYVVDPGGRISAVRVGAVSASWLRRALRVASRSGSLHTK